jgi:hypothetical protein
VRHLLAAVVALAIGALTVLALGGQSRLDGDVIVTLTARHGLHQGDLVALGVAAVGLGTLAVLHLAGRRPRRERAGRHPHDGAGLGQTHGRHDAPGVGSVR